MSSYLSLFSCNTKYPPPTWDLQFKGTKHPSVAWSQLTSSCSQKRQEPEALPWRRWDTKVRGEQIAQHSKGWRKWCLPWLIYPSPPTATIPLSITPSSPLIGEEANTTRPCPCALRVKGGTYALMAPPTKPAVNGAQAAAAKPKWDAKWEPVMSVWATTSRHSWEDSESSLLRLNNHNSLRVSYDRCPSTSIFAEVFSRLSPCPCLPCFGESSVDRPLQMWSSQGWAVKKTHTPPLI